MSNAKAAITNLGKYNEGELAFVWLDLPATAEAFNAALDSVGIGHLDSFGIPYEEWFVSDYDCDAVDLYAVLGEYPSLDMMNKAASLSDELADIEDDPLALSAWCEDHGLEPGDYGLDDVFDCDDEIIDGIVSEELKKGGWQRVMFFLAGCIHNTTASYYTLDGYCNLVPYELDGSELKSILADAVAG